MKYKNSAFSIVELLVAMGIASIVITSALGTVGQIYFSQKKVIVAQDFYAESRFLMERLVQTVRNNTIDYDRYFIEVGPDPTSCSSFDANQLPEADSSTNNTTENREILGYTNIFYWDTNGDNIPDRNLGGADLDGELDPCSQTWYEEQKTLRLINGARTLQTAMRKTVEETGENVDKLEIQRRLGTDTDNDGIADKWSPFTSWENDTTCNIYEEVEKNTLLGEAKGVDNEDACLRAHDWTVISPDALVVTSLTFEPSPDRDPFLNFRLDESQVHPHVFISLQTKLRRPSNFGFELGKEPTLSLQTSASSRVFGDPRK